MRAVAALCALVACGLGSTAAPGIAHQKRVARQGMITVRAAANGVEIDALVVMRFGGERALSFLARYDLNRDGKLNEGEGKLLADTLSPDALGGLVVRQGKAALRPNAAQGRGRRVDRDTLEIALLVTWPADLAAGSTFSVVEKIGPMGAPTTALQIQASALPPLRLRSQASPTKGGVVGPVVLVPDEAGLVFTVDSPVSSDPAGTPKPRTDAPASP